MRLHRTGGAAERFLYRKYPAFLAALAHSNVFYNRTCDRLEQLEKEGRILVIYQSGKNNVAHLEGDMEKLGRLYFEGMETVQDRMGEIREYLNMVSK